MKTSAANELVGRIEVTSAKGETLSDFANVSKVKAPILAAHPPQQSQELKRIAAVRH